MGYLKFWWIFFFLIFFLITKANLFIDNRLFSSFLFMLSHVLYIYIYFYYQRFTERRGEAFQVAFTNCRSTRLYTASTRRRRDIKLSAARVSSVFTVFASCQVSRIIEQPPLEHVCTHARVSSKRNESNPSIESNEIINEFNRYRITNVII